MRRIAGGNGGSAARGPRLLAAGVAAVLLALVGADAALGASQHVPPGAFAALGVGGCAVLVAAAKALGALVQRADREEDGDG